VIATIAILAMALVLFVALFDPGLRYKISATRSEKLDSDEFLYEIEALTDAKVNRRVSLQVLTNGNEFYEAELQAIAAARQSVNLEAYIFQRGEIAERYLKALAERARAEVKVNVVLDGVGSAGVTESYVQELKEAGGKVAFYNPMKWHRLPRYNNRTHRELLVVDGDVAFVGGAGIADHWYTGKDKNPRWRDTMVRVEGDAVPNLQATFAENWLEACGELLTGPEYFKVTEAAKDTVAMVVNSTPSAGGSTRARVLFQVLLASAQKSIDVTTPYFLPDKAMSDELVRAVQERGVRVNVLVPGRHNDHMLTRSSSRAAYGKLLKAGIRIFEFEPSMLHAKILLVDGLWSVVGSTNFDNRSFGLNDEVNLAVRDAVFTERLEQDYARDLANSREVTLEDWRKRSIFERAPELLGWVLERQQ
jgi:cardiolipin synthase